MLDVSEVADVAPDGDLLPRRRMVVLELPCCGQPDAVVVQQLAEVRHQRGVILRVIPNVQAEVAEALEQPASERGRTESSGPAEQWPVAAGHDPMWCQTSAGAAYESSSLYPDSATGIEGVTQERGQWSGDGLRVLERPAHLLERDPKRRPGPGRETEGHELGKELLASDIQGIEL